jgi:hypothetical protein
MAFKNITFVATENFILIVYKGQRTQITKAEKPEQFEKLRELLRAQNEEEIIKQVNGNSHLVEEHSSGLFIVDRQNKQIIDKETNTEVGIVLGKRIVQWAEEGLPFEPLLKFHRKVIQNPSKESAAELYEFLEKNNIPITQEGNFVAYKKVTTVGDNLMDSHSRKINNNVGNVVQMDRSKVDPNRRNECSYGLHVGAWGYVSSFSGDTITEVEVEPQHVVAVPRDYNSQKMRVCEYKVLRAVNHRREEIKAKLITVKKEVVGENKIAADVNEGVDFSAMTAQKIKDYIKEHYGIEITTDNKNKQSIIKQANKIVHGPDATKDTKAEAAAPAVIPASTRAEEDFNDFEDDEDDFEDDDDFYDEDEDEDEDWGW